MDEAVCACGRESGTGLLTAGAGQYAAGDLRAGFEQQDRGTQMDDGQYGCDERTGFVRCDGGLGHRGFAGGIRAQLTRIDAVGIPGLCAADPHGDRTHPAVLRSAAQVPHCGRRRGRGVCVLLQRAAEGAEHGAGGAHADAGVRRQCCGAEAHGLYEAGAERTGAAVFPAGLFPAGDGDAGAGVPRYDGL